MASQDQQGTLGDQERRVRPVRMADQGSPVFRELSVIQGDQGQLDRMAHQDHKDL